MERIEHYHKILQKLTKHADEQEAFDDGIEQLLHNIAPLLLEEDRKFITSQCKYEDKLPVAKYQYLRTISNILKSIQNVQSSDKDALFSVSQFRDIRVAVNLIMYIGILPCLIPNIGTAMRKLYSHKEQLCEAKMTDLQKYEWMSFSVEVLMKLYRDSTLRPAVLSQLGPLLAALLQLSHAPLMKPVDRPLPVEANYVTTDGFIMTRNLYDDLKNNEERFHKELNLLLNDSPQTVIVKELMVILGVKGAPKWLRIVIQKSLISIIMQPNGVMSMISAICDDVLDIGEHWNKLETASKLIVTAHGTDPAQYYKSVCSQILDILDSTKIKYSSTIANCCIVTLYEANSIVCETNIIKKIVAPLLVSTNQENETNVAEISNNVEDCLEKLVKCFIHVEARFKHLPIKVISVVAFPLLSLHVKVHQSAYGSKGHIKQLLLKLLQEESLREDLFSAYLGHRINQDFGQYVISEFGSTGELKVIRVEKSIDNQEYADTLLNLVILESGLSISLFSYLLKYLTNLYAQDYTDNKTTLLETEGDMFCRIEKHLIAVKLLSTLANTSIIQEAYIKNPEPIFTFIRSLFNEYFKRKKHIEEEDNSEILYISLMLIKMILSDNKKFENKELFQDFTVYLKECCSIPQIPAQLLILIQEIIDLAQKQHPVRQSHYQDLSVSGSNSTKFDEAIKDLSDPLLPVRGHGLIALTHLIENKDPCTIARKAITLQLFQENLKHDDSFIYLASINGLCALATSYPQIVIEVLVQEFIDMPQRRVEGGITAETRMKLGEILVKTTKALGEMASVYKTILVNGFLCATRDPDHLVRASSLSCLGELCKVLGYKVGNIIIEVLYCIGCIIKTDKSPECRRAAVLVATLLLRGLGKDVLTSLDTNLVPLFRGLKYLRDNDDDPVLRLHAQLALEEFDHIVQNFLFSAPKLEKTIFLLP